MSRLGLRAHCGRIVAFARDERGQLLFLTGATTVVLIGVVALVVDAGGWLHDGRRIRAAADAGALSGAITLAKESDAGMAAGAACTYVGANFASAACQPQVSTDALPIPGLCAAGSNNCVSVTTEGTSPSFLAQLFGITSATVRAAATATVFDLTQPNNVAPITLPEDEALNWQSNTNVTFTFNNNTQGGSSAFGFLNLCGTEADAIANCISNGCSCALSLGTAQSSSPGNKWESNPVRQAFQQLIDTQTPILVPVYASVSTGVYNIVGFASFIITAYDPNARTAGQQGTVPQIEGDFLGMVWQGTGGNGGCQCGAFTISITR